MTTPSVSTSSLRSASSATNLHDQQSDFDSSATSGQDTAKQTKQSPPLTQADSTARDIYSVSRSNSSAFIPKISAPPEQSDDKQHAEKSQTVSHFLQSNRAAQLKNVNGGNSASAHTEARKPARDSSSRSLKETTPAFTSKNKKRPLVNYSSSSDESHGHTKTFHRPENISPTVKSTPLQPTQKLTNTASPTITRSTETSRSNSSKIYTGEIKSLSEVKPLLVPWPQPKWHKENLQNHYEGRSKNPTNPEEKAITSHKKEFFVLSHQSIKTKEQYGDFAIEFLGPPLALDITKGKVIDALDKRGNLVRYDYQRNLLGIMDSNSGAILTFFRPGFKPGGPYPAALQPNSRGEDVFLDAVSRSWPD